MLNPTHYRLALAMPAAPTGASTRILSPVRRTASGIGIVRTDGGMNLPCPLLDPLQQVVFVRAA